MRSLIQLARKVDANGGFKSDPWDLVKEVLQRKGTFPRPIQHVSELMYEAIMKIDEIARDESNLKQVFNELEQKIVGQDGNLPLAHNALIDVRMLSVFFFNTQRTK